MERMARMLKTVTATLNVAGEMGDLMALVNDHGPMSDTLRDFGLELQEDVQFDDGSEEGEESWLNDYFGARVRPAQAPGITVEVQTAGGTMFVTVNVDEHKRPFEVFLRIGKAGEVEYAHLEGLGRMVSYCLRIGGDPDGVINHLKGITSEPVWDKGALIRSAEDGVAYVLNRIMTGYYDRQLDRLLEAVEASRIRQVAAR